MSESPADDGASGEIDVLVIGAGAAGLFAATAAAERGRRTVLLEKNRRPGVKILASGGTRCNVTSTLPIAALGRLFGRRAERFLRFGLHEMSPLRVRELLAAEDVPTTDHPLEKVFPASGKAGDVLDAFLRRAQKAGVEIRTHAGVLSIERRAAGGFVVRTTLGDVEARSVVVAAGGKSYPKTGCTGDAYAWLEGLGHTITPTRPALVPLVVDLPWVRALTGIAVEDATVRAVAENGKVAFERRRPVLFTHRGLSGPGPMDASRYLNDRPAARLEIDWLPRATPEQIEARLEPSRRGAALASFAVANELPKRLISGLMLHAGIPEERTLAQLKREERRALVAAVKRCRIPIKGDEGFDKAEVTAGGAELDEFDPVTMQSRRVSGLYVAGEVLDIDGPIGGFNFQAAFSTGFAAGLGVSRR